MRTYLTKQLQAAAATETTADYESFQQQQQQQKQQVVLCDCQIHIKEVKSQIYAAGSSNTQQQQKRKYCLRLVCGEKLLSQTKDFALGTCV